MPLQIHQNLRQRLTIIATEAISQMHVEKGIFLAADAADLLAPGDAALDGKLRQELSRVISDRPFSGFVVGFVGDELSRTFKYEDVEPKALVGLRGFEDAAAVAAGVIDAFVSLPWTYKFIYPLSLKATYGDGIAGGDKEYGLSHNVSLVRPGPEFSMRYPTPKIGETLEEILTARFRDDEPGEWASDTLYLVLTENGFLTRSFSTQLAKNARLTVRMIAGLMESSGFVEYNYVFTAWSDTRFQRHSWIYSYVGRSGAWELSPSVKLDSDHAERLRSLRWSDVPDIQAPLWDEWILAMTLWTKPAFGASDGAALLRRCAQWHFDCLCGDNELLQFVQATVAVEILLGDKASSDVVGLGELLANRCAYSIARNAAERTQLLAEFKQIYDTRSQIVHRGKPDLSEGETEQLWRLKNLGRKLIRNEIDLMSGRRQR